MYKSTNFCHFILGNEIYFAAKEIKGIKNLDLSPLYNTLHLAHWKKKTFSVSEFFSLKN